MKPPAIGELVFTPVTTAEALMMFPVPVVGMIERCPGVPAPSLAKTPLASAEGTIQRYAAGIEGFGIR